MRLTPRLFLEISALVELYNAEIAAAKAAESEGGEVITPAEMFGIAIAVGGPALKKFFIPGLPDETIDAAALAIASSVGRLTQVRAKAATILDRVEAGASGVLNLLKD